MFNLSCRLHLQERVCTPTPSRDVINWVLIVGMNLLKPPDWNGSILLRSPLLAIPWIRTLQCMELYLLDFSAKAWDNIKRTRNYGSQIRFVPISFFVIKFSTRKVHTLICLMFMLCLSVCLQSKFMWVQNDEISKLSCITDTKVCWFRLNQFITKHAHLANLITTLTPNILAITFLVITIINPP